MSQLGANSGTHESALYPIGKGWLVASDESRPLLRGTPPQRLLPAPIHGVILTTSSEKFTAPIDSRACTAALVRFRSRATKLFCPTHGVQAIRTVTDVATRGEQTKYDVRLDCGCSRPLFYTNESTAKSRRAVVETVEVM